MVPNVAFGSHTRVVLDVGCGVASFGAYLLSRDVLTLSIAPKDVHENQIQFALERGACNGSSICNAPIIISKPSV
jgi:2-polyprenyl-3-methyl-5-hydroxy-6-metoxy-1,4-benzoquinol methylase